MPGSVLVDTKQKTRRRERRRRRVRKKVFGTPERPRLSLFKSHKHIYGQLVDDVAGKTLCTASSLAKGLERKLKNGGNKEAARTVGGLLAEKAKALEIAKVVFDRSGYKYHGRVKELADAARKGGLVF